MSSASVKPSGSLDTEVFYHLPIPCCCITTGSEFVATSQSDMLVKYKNEICSMGTCCGGGYDTYLFDWRQIALYGYHQAYFCLFPCWALNIAYLRTNVVDKFLRFLVPSSGQQDYVEKLHAFTAKHHRRGTPLTEAEWTYRPVCCPCDLYTTKLHQDHSFSITHSSSGFCNSEHKLVGWAESIQNVSAASAGCCCSLCGAPSSITLQLANGGTPVSISAYTYPGYSEEAAVAFAEAAHGAPLSAPLAEITGDDGTVMIGPQWTKLTRKNCNLCLSDITCGCCDVNEVVVFRTSQIAYLRGMLQSSAPYFTACCLSFFCIQNESRKNRNVPGCIVCPFPFAIIRWFMLWLSEVLLWINQSFCRRTHIVFGGSGVNSDISFPVAEAPEAQLREYAGVIKMANERSGAAKHASNV